LCCFIYAVAIILIVLFLIVSTILDLCFSAYWEYYRVVVRKLFSSLTRLANGDLFYRIWLQKKLFSRKPKKRKRKIWSESGRSEYPVP